ncbi:MAG: hypothetical protein JKZ03_00565 [Flavobacteriaceae bacterium]|nr:hypothetical protein [Flavobacteriaceae bacterium]
MSQHKGSHHLNIVIHDLEEKININMPSRRHKVKISQELLKALDDESVLYKLN